MAALAESRAATRDLAGQSEVFRPHTIGW